MLGLGTYYYYFPPSSDQHQPNAGDGRIFGSPDSKEPEPQQLDDPEGEPIPLDMGAVAKHAKRLDQRAKSTGQDEQQRQPNAGDGRVLGSDQSQEPVPEQQATGKPLALDLDAVDKHQQRLDEAASRREQQSSQHQPQVGDGRKMGSPDSREPEALDLSEGEQHQPRVGDGRKMGSPDSKEPEALDSSEGEQHQPRVGDGRKMGSPDSTEPEALDLSEGEQHQPRVGDGRKMGSPDSWEPEPVVLDNGEPNQEAVAKHAQRLEERVKQRQARHENSHSDEFALSGKDPLYSCCHSMSTPCSKCTSTLSSRLVRGSALAHSFRLAGWPKDMNFLLLFFFVTVFHQTVLR